MNSPRTTVDVERSPVGGRTVCLGAGQQRRYFGALPATLTISGFPAVDKRFAVEWDAEAPELRLWRITSTVRERQRFVPAGTIGPLSTSQIFADEGSFADRSLIKVRLSLSGVGFQKRSFLLDVGQSIDVYARKVDAEWVGPQAFVEEPSPTAQAGPGIVCDGIVGLRAFGIETFGIGEALLTTYAVIPSAPSIVLIPIPRGAVDVTVYQSPAGVDDLPEVLWAYGVVGLGAVAVGVLSFIPTLRRTESVSVVPGVTHLAVQGVPAATQVICVWTIRP